ncbi:hydrolase [Brachyspira suanatina]|uniref:Hydrolase n=1 Tax=Brachyspira suanatina TaxID=381802 RepID=A0A0G4K4J9_9SPIR|nr:Cof-type HAD-IIB family hydrolase [Brachyspira suanatina]CRF31979.1 hydrolase [Brachyspira suanatina]
MNISDISKDKIKLIATDLDGTLLNDKKEIGDYTKKILNILMNDYKIELVLSSGRPYEGIINYNKILENDNCSIIFNGANIVDKEGKVIYKKTIEENACRSIINMSAKYDVCIHVYDNGKYIVSKEDFPIKSYVQKDQSLPAVYGLNNINNYVFDKMLILGDRGILDNLKSEIDSQFDVHSCFSGPFSLEITSKGTNKGNALKWICNNKGIDIKDIISFGDNFNDVEMVEYAGVGVAMANAEEELKQKADYIALSNDEDGVGKFLSNIFSIQ